MEIERFRKLTQKDIKKMYDKSLEDRYKVKQIEKQMDEVRRKKEQTDILSSYLGRR